MGGFRLYYLVAASVLVCGLAALLPLAWIGSGVLESSYREYAVRDMSANANLLALAAEPLLERNETDRLEQLVRRARKGSYTRFTIISPDGSVLIDSDEAAGRMENHGNRPEVKAALAGGTGVDIRRSPTLKTEWIYAAVPLSDGKVVRGAASLEDLNRRLSQWWTRAIIGFSVSTAVLLALALLIARAVTRPLEAAAEGAERFATGDFSHHVPVSGSAEMRKLSRALGAMAAQLDSRFRLIHRQREEMRAVFENMSEGVLAVDPDGRVMMLNGAAEKLLSVPSAAAGKAIETVSRNPDLLDALKAASASGRAVEREVRAPAAGQGGELLLLVHAAPIIEDDRQTGVLAVLRDVTRLRRLETMRRDFVANVSHELRTPITSIQGCLEALSDGGGTDTERAEFLDMALRNTRRMGAIVSNLLLLAGMESGEDRDAAKTAPTPVGPVIDEVLELCGDAADARSVTFSVTCDEGLSAIMNRRLIIHALVNLVDNAIKYGPERGEISVRARRENECVRITVGDHGPGIEHKHIGRIFERFYRVGGKARVSDGSGLGLALVKHIALTQGGDVTLESEIGAGSAFTLSLPAAPENA